MVQYNCKEKRGVKTKMSLQSFERETSIWFSDDDSIAMIYTCNKSWINKLDKLVAKFPKEYKLIKEIVIDGDVVGKEYSTSKKLVSVRTPSNRKMTEEQKKAVGERLRKYRNK